MLLKDEVGFVKKKKTEAINTNSVNKTKIKPAKRGFSLNIMRTRNIRTKGKGTSKITLKHSTFSYTRRDTRVANGGTFKDFLSETFASVEFGRICCCLVILGPPLWSSGQSFWLQVQRSRVRFPALPDFSE